LAQLLYPLRHFVEGVLICYVVHDKGTYTHLRKCIKKTKILL
jgi:hypothetical protein